jgi:1,4-dihydroxy-2-naphthoate octaprenyltransferase
MSTETDTAVSDWLARIAGVARVPFLALPVALGALGVAATIAATGSVDPVRAVVATGGLVAAHVAVNALNEARDYETGVDFETDPTPFSGGSGTLPGGDLTPRGARGVGYAALAIAGVVGIWAVWLVGLVLLPVIAIGAVTILAYTPVFTKYGLGEVAAGAGLGLLPVVGIGLVQTGQFSPELLAVSVPPFFLTFNLLLLNEFPDFEADRVGDRRNLLHRLGTDRGGQLYVLTGLAAALSVIVAVAAGVIPLTALFALLAFGLFARSARWALDDPGTGRDVPVDALKANVGWILATNFLLAVGVAAPAFL